MSKATVRYAVRCQQHGMDLKSAGWKAVFVGKPASRGAMRNAGCPMCKSEKSKSSAQVNQQYSYQNGMQMKKFWNITGTNIYGATKVELKAQRDKLNHHAIGLKPDQSVKDIPSNQWPHRISKGPEHPGL